MYKFINTDGWTKKDWIKFFKKFGLCMGGVFVFYVLLVMLFLAYPC